MFKLGIPTIIIPLEISPLKFIPSLNFPFALMKKSAFPSPKQAILYKSNYDSDYFLSLDSIKLGWFSIPFQELKQYSNK